MHTHGNKGAVWALLLGGACLLSTQAAHAEVSLKRAPEDEPVEAKIGRKSESGFVVTGAKALELRAIGPGEVSLRVMRKLPAKRPRRAGPASVTITVDGEEVASIQAKARPGRARIPSQRIKLGRPESASVQISEGEHALVIAVAADDEHGVVVFFKKEVGIAEAQPAEAEAPAAEGEEAAAEGGAAVAEGEETAAEGGAAVAEGEETAGEGEAAVAEGEETPAEGGAAVAEPKEAVVEQAEDGAAREVSEEPAEASEQGEDLLGDASAGDASAEVAQAEVVEEIEAEQVGSEGAVSGVGAQAEIVQQREAKPFEFRLGLRMGAYHPMANSDLGASVALGGEARLVLPILPERYGRLSTALSGSWQRFTRSETLSDDELGEFGTDFTLDFIPLTIEAVYEPPRLLDPVIVYGGIAGALYVAKSRSQGFGAVDERTVLAPALQAFGAAGIMLGPVMLAMELRFTNVTIDFDTGTVGSGSGLFAQAVANVALF